jgi:Bacterial low temperature requirement A protein (LtrA)
MVQLKRCCSPWRQAESDSDLHDLAPRHLASAQHQPLDGAARAARHHRIGTSIVAIGTGAADAPSRAGLLIASVLGVVIAICLWWSYFDVVAVAAEEEMAPMRGDG